jgi:outer membrane protein
LSSVALAQVPMPTSPPPTQPPLDVRPRRAASLKEVLTLADQKSPDLKSARAQAMQVIAQTRQAFGAALPEITFNASYVHTSAPQEFKLDIYDFAYGVSRIQNGYSLGTTGRPAVPDLPEEKPAGFEDTATRTVIVDRNSFYATLQLTQTLFTPALFALPAAEQGRAAAELGAEEAREQILLNVSRIYFGAQGLDGLVQAARDAETTQLRRERDAKAKLEVGTGTAVEVLRAQAETAAGKNQLSMLEAQRENLLALLEALVGEAVRPTEGGIEALEVGAPGREEDRPWDATFVVKAQKRAISAQESVLTWRQLAWMPSLVGIAKGGYNSNKGFADTNFTGDLIVALNWTLFDRGARYVALHEDEAKLIDARAKYEAASAKARATWLSAQTNMKAAEAQLRQSEAQLELASRAQREIDNAVKGGLATALELSDIDSKRFFAQSATAQARSQLQTRKIELAAAEGRLAAVFGLTEKAIK